MLKTALVSAFALATVGCFSVTASGVRVAQSAAQETTASVGDVLVTESKIAHLKRVLHLTPAQEVHWHPVEASLRRLIQASHREASIGLVQRVRNGVSAYAVSAIELRRVAHTAGPLIAMLDDQQKQEGMRVIREIGLDLQ
jgi:hypothetical protein